jgi:hypothetical protein
MGIAEQALAGWPALLLRSDFCRRKRYDFFLAGAAWATSAWLAFIAGT